MELPLDKSMTTNQLAGKEKCVGMIGWNVDHLCPGKGCDLYYPKADVDAELARLHSALELALAVGSKVNKDMLKQKDAEIAQVRNIKDEYGDLISIMTAEISQLQEECVRRKELQKERDNQIASLQEELNSASFEISSLAFDKNQLEVNLNLAKDQIASLTNELEQAKEQVSK